jgi:hypothetical protein
MAGYISFCNCINTNILNMETERPVGRPTIKPKRIPSTFGVNSDLSERIKSYVNRTKRTQRGYSANDFINEAIMEKLNGSN